MLKHPKNGRISTLDLCGSSIGGVASSGIHQARWQGRPIYSDKVRYPPHRRSAQRKTLQPNPCTASASQASCTNPRDRTESSSRPASLPRWVCLRGFGTRVDDHHAFHAHSCRSRPGTPGALFDGQLPRRSTTGTPSRCPSERTPNIDVQCFYPADRPNLRDGTSPSLARNPLR